MSTANSAGADEDSRELPYWVIVGRRSLNPTTSSEALKDHMTNQADHLSTMTDAWTQFTESMFRGAMAANTAALSAFEVRADDSERGNGTGTPPKNSRPGVDSVLYEADGWMSKRSVEKREDLEVGDFVEFVKLLSDEDVTEFAHASGDTNRLHLDEEFGEETRFGGRIAHGTLVSGLISAALARIPGLTTYLSQDMEFRSPVPIGEKVRAYVEVVEDLGNDQYRLKTQVTDEDGDRVVIDGEAVVIIDDMPGGE